jgi:hypothetical protein
MTEAEPLTLSEEQAAAVADARRALSRSLYRAFPPRMAGILAAVALAEGFTALVIKSAGRDQLVDIINSVISEAGLRLVEMPRH